MAQDPLAYQRNQYDGQRERHDDARVAPSPRPTLHQAEGQEAEAGRDHERADKIGKP